MNFRSVARFLALYLLAAGATQAHETQWMPMPVGESTGSADDSDVRFIVLGDSQFSRPDIFERVIHEVNMLHPDFAIQVGDLIQGYTHDRETLREEWKRFHRQIEPIGVDYYPVPGNHDVVTPESEEIYKEVWGEDRLVYSFSRGPGHFISLDTFWGDEHDRLMEWQREWLREDLEKYAAQYGGKGSKELEEKSIFIFMHSPLWRYGKDHPGRQDWEKAQEILEGYPVKLVVGGHTHEYVYQEDRGVDYLVINTSGGSTELERGGKFFAYMHVTVEPGEVYYAVLKAGSVLPIDTVDSEDRSSVPRYALSGKALRLPDWRQGEPFNEVLEIPISNSLDKTRLMRLDWHIPYQADLTIEPAGMWLEIPAGETANPSFQIKTGNAPGPGKMPWLEVSTEEVLPTRVVSSEWEERYRSGEVETAIRLDAPVTFDARYVIYVPPVVDVLRREGEIALDGKFDEPAWEAAGVIDDITHKDGSAPEVETRVRLLYDDDYLYVAAWLGEPFPDKTRARAEGDIPLTWDDDDFEMFFDPAQSQSDYWRLFQNIAGTRFNSKPRNVPDKYFKSDYESAIHVGEDYWAIEMQIPWSDIDLEEGPEPGDEWNFNVGRHRQQSYVPEMQWAGNLYDTRRYGVLRFR